MSLTESCGEETGIEAVFLYDASEHGFLAARILGIDEGEWQDLSTGRNNAVVRRANGGLCELVLDQVQTVADKAYSVHKTSGPFHTQWDVVLGFRVAVGTPSGNSILNLPEDLIF